MTHYIFTQMPSAFQLTWVLSEGTYLAWRWQEDGVVNLYHLPDERRGFFVEVGYDAYQQDTMVLCSFSNSAPLGDYANAVQLSELW